mgnify:CR=1 FL=1
MKKIKVVLLIGMIFLMGLQSTYAQSGNIKKIAQTGLQFLKVDMSARAAGMASAYTMIGNDASSVFYNPAGLTQMESTYDAMFTRTQWIADISYNAGAVAADFGNIGTFGLSFISADYGDIQGTRIASNTAGYDLTEKLDVGATAVGLAYARALNNKFTVGGNVKWVSQRLGSNIIDEETVKNEVSSVAVDFGTIFYPGYIPSLRLGMNIRNFSGQLVYEEEEFDIPLNFRIGVAFDAFDFFGGSPNNALTLSVDALHPKDYTERLHLGAEYMFLNTLAFSAGYKTNYDEEGLTLGFGLNYELAGVRVKADYAWASMGIFSGINRFTLGAAF